MFFLSLRYTRRVFTKTRIPPFINLATTYTAEKLCNNFEKYRGDMGKSTRSIAFTAGIDATIFVKLWQLLPSYGAIVGRSYPNHFLTVVDKYDKQIIALAKNVKK